VSPVQPAGNYYDKYYTRNPIARYLMRGFIDAFDSLWKKTGVGNAIEVGCGEGELSMRLAASGIRMRAFDIADEVIAEARRRARAAAVEIEFTATSLDKMENTDPSPLVVCCEVLEHLEDPEGGLGMLEHLTTRWLLVSVPREPIWRALNVMRGKYVSQLGNTPGHVNHWSRPAFKSFIASRFDIVEIRSPLPWTMLLCQRR
jgi:2-polyprenyl-3-methyl-5-hydroxy-6-metoxy-1,4-benzoquinol methylase